MGWGGGGGGGGNKPFFGNNYGCQTFGIISLESILGACINLIL